MRPIALLALVALAVPAAAQDRQGNNTPGDWIVTHTGHFGQWDSICDERPESDGMERRCYIRYVDVFSPRPRFAAHFLFVTPENGGTRIEYGSEPGTRFAPGGNRIERGGKTVWLADGLACLTGGNCVFAGDTADDLYSTLKGGGQWRFLFADRHGQLQDLTWDLTPFADAAAEFEAEANRRGLR
jgi:hypothetical protein